MRRHRPVRSGVIQLLTAALGFYFALKFGWVPPRFNPLAPLSLSEPAPWFLDLRLSALRRDIGACRAALKSPVILAEPIDDQTVKAGCGWNNAVRVTMAGGVRAPVGTLTCEMAAALAMWLEHAVQPSAVRHFGQRVTSLHHMGSYACRNIVGSRLWQYHRSQHATANALDIESFTLADGRTVRVLKHWKGETPEAQFLHEVHRQSCSYFRAALGPGFNEAHANHLHLDRGPYSSCK
jgi:hypothetical protein